jgi:hypothetical protein
MVNNMAAEAQGRGGRYEIRLAGRLGPALQLAFPGLQARVEPRHSVLILAADGDEQLTTVLAGLRRRSIRVVRARLTRPPREAAAIRTTRRG